MEIDAAKSIIGELAHGVNPLTGEELPHNSLYNDLDIISALFCLLDAVPDKRQSKPGRRQRQQENQKEHTSLPTEILVQSLE